MRAYIDHLSSTKPGWQLEEQQQQQQKGQAGKHGSTLGPVFSTMANATGEEEEMMNGEGQQVGGEGQQVGGAIAAAVGSLVSSKGANVISHRCKHPKDLCGLFDSGDACHVQAEKRGELRWQVNV